MNLKQAANQLGVHYQTAYKWVRTGHLSAVRVGGRYEVSDAAIERFAARRAATRTDPDDQGIEPAIAAVEPEDVLEEFEAMAADPYLSILSTATFAARRGADLIGDLCVATCFAHDGRPRLSAVNHPNPAHATLIHGMVDLLGPASTREGFAFPGFDEQQPTRVDHVPQDVVRSWIRPELRQHLDWNPIRCLLASPVKVNGRTAGVIAVTRSDSRPYSDHDEQMLQGIAERLGVLFATASDVELAIEFRDSIVNTLTARVAEAGTFAPGELDELLDEVGGKSHLPITILDGERRFLALNRAFGEIRGQPTDAIIGTTFESMTHPDDRQLDRDTFSRLISGELDYHDVSLRRVLMPEGRELAYTSHRAAVRAPDASLQHIVTVVRPLRPHASDVTAIGETVLRSIGAGPHD